MKKYFILIVICFLVGWPLRTEAFSAEMIEATQSCTQYVEDVPTKADEIPISMRIEGKKEELCLVVLKPEIDENERIECALNEEQLGHLVEVMQNMPADAVDAEWGKLWEEFAQSSCGLNEIKVEAAAPAEPVQADVVDYFAPEFMAKLRQCEAAVSAPIGYEEDDAVPLEIVAKQGDKCELKYDQYQIKAPLDILPNIHSFEDLQVILRNKEMAHYDYTPQYVYDGLLYALDACRNKRDYMGRQTSGQVGKATYNAGLTAEYFNQICTIYLSNQLNVMGNQSDWTVTCRLKDAEVAEILSYYQQILDEYGKKQRQVVDGRLQTVPAKENEVTQQADKELMYYLQQNDFCRKPNMN